MKQQHKNILRIAAFIDILIALGIFAAIVLSLTSVPIILPVLLAFTGVTLAAVTFMAN